MRLIRYCLLVVLMLLTQQLGLVHGYRHVAELTASAHSVQGDGSHGSLASCPDCVALAGTGPVPTASVVAFVAAAPHRVSPVGAVPPAPTFAYRTAFDSRAPPQLPS